MAGNGKMQKKLRRAEARLVRRKPLQNRNLGNPFITSCKRKSF